MNDHARVMAPESAAPEERRRWICRVLEQQGAVEIEELARQTRVQPITIRRDLEALGLQNLLIRVRGGAVRNERVRLEFSYEDRLKRHSAEKLAIARHAATLVQPGQTIILDTGTTTQLLARELATRGDLQIVTNSMVVANELRGALGISVILLGGQARRGGFELVGPITERLLTDLRADIAFLGADAIDADTGFYTTDLGVARVEELMVRAAARSVVLADASKLGERAFARYAGFDQISLWITSGQIPTTLRRRVRRCRSAIVHIPAANGRMR